MFNLDLATEYATEQGFEVNRQSKHLLVVNIGYDLHLCFENWPQDNETVIYFDDAGSDWHSHGDLFIDNDGDLALVPIHVLEALQNGSFLVSIVRYSDGRHEISLEYSWSKFELNTLEEGEKQTFIRILKTGSSVPKSNKDSDG